MCVDEVNDEDEGQSLGGIGIGEPLKFNMSTILSDTIDPESIDSELFCRQQMVESDVWAIDPIQVGSRMSQLLHPAACDHSVIMPRCQGYTPASYLTVGHFMTHASTSLGLTFWTGTRWGKTKGPVDLLWSRLHVQKKTIPNLGSWFLGPPVRKEE